MTTVELIIDEGHYFPESHITRASRKPDPARTVILRIDYRESELRQKVKQAGGKWLPEKRRWQVSHHVAEKLGLASRIEEI